MKWAQIVTSVTVLLGIALSIEYFLDAHHYNPGFYEFPITISLHVACGGLSLAFAALQFVAAIRNRMPSLHLTGGWFVLLLSPVRSQPNG